MSRLELTAAVSKEGDWFIAQCVEIDVASQGRSRDEALQNLREALELHLEPPKATLLPELYKIGVDVAA